MGRPKSKTKANTKTSSTIKTVKKKSSEELLENKNINKEVPRISCLNCGNKNKKNFYISHNIYDKHYGVIPYCKTCIRGVMWEGYLKKYNGDEQLAIHALLRSLNLPYIHSLYLSSIKTINNPNSKINNVKKQEDEDGNLNEEVEEDNSINKDNNSALISAYMKNYNSLHDSNGYGDVYADSVGLEEVSGLKSYNDIIRMKRKIQADTIQKENADKYEEIRYDLDDLVYKWGELPEENLIKLELQWLDWQDKLGEGVNEKSIELIVKQICYLTVDIENKRINNEKVKDELVQLQTLMKNSDLIETQKNNSQKKRVIGMEIKDIEMSRPIKKTIPELVDVDHFTEIMDTYIGNTSRALGIENEFTKKCDNIYKKYTIDMDKLNILNSDVSLKEEKNKEDDNNG